MPRTVTTRWTLRALVLLATLLVVQSALAHALALAGATYGGRAWLTGALARDVPYLMRAEIAETSGRADGVVSDEAAGAAARARDGAGLLRVMARLGPRTRWWVFDASTDALVASVQPECADAAQEALGQPRPKLGPRALVCAGMAMLVEARPFAGDSEFVLAYAVPIEAETIDNVHDATGAEAVMLVDGAPTQTSMRNDAGVPTIPEDAVAGLVGDGALDFDEVDVEFPGYAGFLDFDYATRLFADDDRMTWLRTTTPLQDHPRIDMVLLAPRRLMTTGPYYGLVSLAIGGSIALLAAFIALRKLVRSFSEPLDGLVRSARRVSRGDFGTPVAVKPGHDMAEFCTTYNQMLGHLAELMRVRASLAREAGMAEMAIGVLHDVGNALNGVTAAAGLADEQLAHMRLEPLDRLATLLAQHRHELPAFFAVGAPGQLVPEFIAELARVLHRNRARVEEELATVRTASDHACGIVHAQQRYAKRVDIAERCEIDALLEDALRIANIPAKIAVQRVGDGVVASIDRHRAMQILVNLLTNAVDAIGDHPWGHIAIIVDDRGDEVELLVTDDGPGIRVEDRERVFQFGFTTKHDGHGFGLHASSNAATEMGGSLQLRPTEVGLGCQFALVLPKSVEHRAA